METASPIDDLGAGSEHQMIGIREDDLGSEPIDLSRVEGFDRGLRSDRHERRSLDLAARRVYASEPRSGSKIDCAQVERKVASGNSGSDL